ncbi:MAG: nucleotide exchange factor GrpE [Candidatus Omnitrophica bacterium]|nr:nucleotide exchange factor GrpE [Candidatus Omnitrophota bacterium]
MIPKPAHDAVKPAAKAVTVSAQEYDRLLGHAKQAEQYLRQLADVDNTRKRLQREKEEFSRFAAESVIRHLLPIIDSLSQALVAVDTQADPKTIIQGVHLIYRQLLGLLEREGVARITTIGEPFDPHRHEAVAQVDTDEPKADGTVVEEVQVGYTMHGKVLRPAMVKVAKKSSPQTEPSQQQGERKEG